MYVAAAGTIGVKDIETDREFIVPLIGWEITEPGEWYPIGFHEGVSWNLDSTKHAILSVVTK